MNGNDTINLFRTHSDSLWVPNDSPSRAALFGDGIFETMIFTNGKIRFSKAHQHRVDKGILALKLDPSGLSKVTEIEELIANTVDNRMAWRLRWNIFRSGQGKYTPEECYCSEQLIIQDHIPTPKIKNNAYFCTSIHLYPSPWSHCKTLNCLPYVMANLERKAKNMDEVILTDSQGYISEAGAANLFWIKSGIYYTPSLQHHPISGVGRAKIIQRLQQTNIPYLEGSFTKKDLLEADQVFTSNVTGISYIQTIENHRFSTDSIPFLEALFE